jgi:hypothetical protein
MENKIFLSIITCGKNNPSELFDTCTSVRNFTSNLPLAKFQHILLLSCYEPDDIEKVKNQLTLYSENVEYNIVEIKPIGISGSFNMGLKKANSDFIVFLNAGDQFLCDNICINAIETNFIKNKPKHNHVYYFDIFTKGKNTNYLSSRRVSYPSSLNYFHFLKMGNPINHQATIYPINIARKYSYPNISVGMDYQVNLSMILDEVKFVKLDGVLVKYDITGVSAKKPFIRLKQTFPFLLTKAWEYNLFLLVIASVSILPLSIARAIIQKLTYSLR